MAVGEVFLVVTTALCSPVLLKTTFCFFSMRHANQKRRPHQTVLEMPGHFDSTIHNSLKILWSISVGCSFLQIPCALWLVGVRMGCDAEIDG